MFIIDDIIMAPIKGIYSLVRVIHDQMEEELYDPDKIQQELMQLQLQFEMDQIDEETYDAQEEALLERLSESKRRAKSARENG
ncbi:MAG: gas vesicle protein GvpG [Bacteroidota bacterium]